MTWSDWHLKLFMTHISKHKEYVAEVKEGLIDFGVDGFVAHNDISPSRGWEAEIEEALQTCDAAAIFLHDGIRDSDWTDQEMGYCMARNLKIIPLRFDLNPYGFVGRYQAAPCTNSYPLQVAEVIFEALMDDTGTARTMTNSIAHAVCQSESFDQANRRSRALASIDPGNLTIAAVDFLKGALANSQVAKAFDAPRRIERLLALAPADQAPF